MQIGNPVFRSYDNNIQMNSKTEQMKGAEQTGQARGQSDISSLSEGSVFRGEITDISGERVTIATDGKGEVMARLQADMELNIGDQMLFTVKENNASQILIKPMFDSLYSAQTQVLERALEGTGLSFTEKNFSAAKELMEAGMSLDKANMVKLLSQSMKFEGTSMHTLAALNKMNIPVNAENIAQFERYQNYSHQLSNDINQAADSMSEFADMLPKSSSGEELVAVAKQLIDIFNSPEQSGETLSKPDVTTGAANSETLAGEALTGENAAQEGVKEQGSELSAKGLLITEGNARQSEMSGKAAVENSNTDASKGAENSPNVSGVSENIESETESLRTFSDAQLDNIAEKTGLSKNEINNLTENLKANNLTNEQIRNMFEDSKDSADVLKKMVSEFTNASKNDQALKELMSSNEFKKMFSDMVKKDFALNPNEMKDPKEIDDLYNKILKQTQSFENVIQTKGGDTGSLQQNSQNMQQNMQFMQELNNQMVYAQMPLKLSNQNANSELFVYADKRKLAGKRDGISVMLHLDMDHLGATDVKVTLTGTNVNARFYLNDKESVEIVADNMDQLAKQLTEKGFSLTNEVVMRKQEDSPNKVVDEIVDNGAERSIKRFTFDART